MSIDALIDATFVALAEQLPSFRPRRRALTRTEETFVVHLWPEKGRFNSEFLASFSVSICFIDVRVATKPRAWDYMKLRAAGDCVRLIPRAGVVHVSSRGQLVSGACLPEEAVPSVVAQTLAFPELQEVRSFRDACERFGANDAELVALAQGCIRRGWWREARERLDKLSPAMSAWKAAGIAEIESGLASGDKGV